MPFVVFFCARKTIYISGGYKIMNFFFNSSGACVFLMNLLCEIFPNAKI